MPETLPKQESENFCAFCYPELINKQSGLLIFFSSEIIADQTSYIYDIHVIFSYLFIYFPMLLDRVFGPTTTTRHVYDVAAQHVVNGAMEGINGKQNGYSSVMEGINFCIPFKLTVFYFCLYLLSQAPFSLME